MEYNLQEFMDRYAERNGQQWFSAEERLPEEDGEYFVVPHRKGGPYPDIIYFTNNGKSVDETLPDGPTWYYGDPESINYSDPEHPYYRFVYEYWCRGTMYWNKHLPKREGKRPTIKSTNITGK